MSGITERLGAHLGDRYRFERELGAGGMATVYLAEDLRHRRRVAIKILRPELSAVLGGERFLKEIELTANLQHPHLLPLFDSGEADGLLYYVMPYVEGESLRRKLERERQFGIEEAVRITTQVAGALDYAHRHGVIHRDIKPENILLHEGQALIADFGIALAVRQAGGDRLTQTGLSLGTPQYMSPEQATGDLVVDGRSDVYSLACVLYEMLAGQPPHTGASVQAVISKLLAERPRLVTDLRGTVPVHVAAALDVALAKLPADRFQTVAAFSEALTNPSAAVSLQARTATAPTPRRARARALAWPAVALAMALLAAWAYLGRGTAEGDTQVLRLPLTIADPPRSRSTWTDGVRISPDGTRLAYYTSAGWRLLDLETGANTPVSAEVQGLGLAFSPSGDSVALTTRSRIQQTYVADLATGRAHRISECCFGLSEWDGAGWIYHSDENRNLVRTAVDGRREIVDSARGETNWGSANARATADGRLVFFTRAPEGANDPALFEINVKDMETGRTAALLRGAEAIPAPDGHLFVIQADGKVLAARFDARSLSLSGTPVPVLDSVEVHLQNGSRPGPTFSLSREGTLVYVKQRPLTEDTLLVVDRAGRPQGSGTTWGGWVNQVARSDHGEAWAVSVHRGLTSPNIWVRVRPEQPPARLTYSDNLDYFPSFVPGSEELAFIGSTQGRNWDLYRIPVGGGRAPTLILDLPGDIQMPRFSNDGQWVVFCEWDAVGQVDIRAHRLRPDTQTVPLVAGPAWECAPDLSPDGKWLLYESAESGRNQVYVRPFEDPERARWQVTTDDVGILADGSRSSLTGQWQARWSRSGREIFYVNEKREVVSVAVSGGETLSFGSPRVLFPLDDRTVWTGEILPGDEGFIVIRRDLEAPGQVIMIRNFLSLVREKLGS